MKKYEASLIMELLLKDLNCEYVKEHKFHDKRKWRFDYAIPGNKIGIEIEGGTTGNVVTCNHCRQKVGRKLKSGKYVFIREGGRHNSIKGYEKDCEKYNAAAVLGWRLLRYTTNMIIKNPAQVSKDIEKCMEKQL